MKAFFYALFVTLTIVACTSPLDLDVDRTRTFSDGAKHPLRLTFYYYFGDSAYEAIVTDTAFLNHVWIEEGINAKQVTIPGFIFQLPRPFLPTIEYSPFVNKLCFQTEQQPADGVFRLCQNENSWLQGSYLDATGKPVPFRWMADDLWHRIRLAYYDIPEESLIKGSMQIVIIDPVLPTRIMSYRALITMEYGPPAEASSE